METAQECLAVRSTNESFEICFRATALLAAAGNHLWIERIRKFSTTKVSDNIGIDRGEARLPDRPTARVREVAG